MNPVRAVASGGPSSGPCPSGRDGGRGGHLDRELLLEFLPNFSGWSKTSRERGWIADDRLYWLLCSRNTRTAKCVC